MLLHQYINTISPYLIDLLDKQRLSTEDEQKIRLTLTIVFRDVDEPPNKFTFYASSKHIEMRHRDNTNNVFTILIDSFFENYETQENVLRNKSKQSFDHADHTTIYFHAYGINCAGSYIETPVWIKNKNVTINPENMYSDKCFKYAVIATLYHRQIANQLERLNNLRPFANGYSWDGITYPINDRDHDRFEKNNKDIALNVLSAHPTKEKLNIMRISECKGKRPHQIYLLMITKDSINYHYIAIKNLNGLMQEQGSRHRGDFVCLNCMHTFCTKNGLKNHEERCNNPDYCKIDTRNKNNNIFTIYSW